MIFSTKINKVGNSLAILIPKTQLKYMKLKLGDEIKVFINPQVNGKIVYKPRDVFDTSISIVGGSQGFYVNKQVVEDLGLEKGLFVEVIYKKVV